MKAILLRGAPGTGKTSLAEYIANLTDSVSYYYLCHKWTSQEELFYKIDINKVVLKKEYPYQEGILLKAIKQSLYTRTVVILDELDKTKEHVDNLLLDFIQNCRLETPEGIIKGNSDNIILFITSNDERELSQPLLRRIAKITLPHLPPDVEQKLLVNDEEYYIDKIRRFVIKYCTTNEIQITENQKLQKLLIKVANRLRSNGYDVSLYELRNLYKTIHLCEDTDEVKFAIEMWLGRNNEYLEEIDRLFKGTENLANAIWSVYKAKEKEAVV